jgi:hypothetical protein
MLTYTQLSKIYNASTFTVRDLFGSHKTETYVCIECKQLETSTWNGSLLKIFKNFKFTTF